MSGITDADRQRGTATRLGISYEEYAAHKAAGEKWCYRLRHWLPEAAFSSPRATSCRSCTADYQREYARRRPPRPRGTTPRQTRPTPPPAPEAPAVEEPATVEPSPVLARITAAWDAAAARRVRERELRRAERRRSA